MFILFQSTPFSDDRVKGRGPPRPSLYEGYPLYSVVRRAGLKRARSSWRLAAAEAEPLTLTCESVSEMRDARSTPVGEK